MARLGKEPLEGYDGLAMHWYWEVIEAPTEAVVWIKGSCTTATNLRKHRETSQPHSFRGDAYRAWHEYIHTHAQIPLLPVQPFIMDLSRLFEASAAMRNAGSGAESTVPDK